MKKMVGIFLAMTVTLSLFAGVTVSAADKVVEYVTNGGFEVDDFKGTGWTTNDSLVRSTDKFHGGSASLKLTSSKQAYAYHVLEELQPGRPYTFAGWFNIDAGEKATATVVFDTNGDGKYITKNGSDKDEYIDFSTTAVALNEWTELTGTFEVPAGASGVRLQLLNNGGGTTVYWDDISVTWVKHPELLPATLASCDTTDGWGVQPSTTVLGTDVDAIAGRTAIKVNPETNGGTGTATFESNKLKAGKAFRFSFWFKSDSASKPVPYVRIDHTYTNSSEESTILYTEFDKSYFYFRSGIKSSTNIALDENWKLAMATTNEWKQYTLYFTLPKALGESSEYEYTKTKFYLGQTGTYKTDGTIGDMATVYFDSLALTEDYDEVTFYNEQGTKITSAAAGEEVTAQVHIASSGNAADSGKTAAVLAATYKTDGEAKQLLEIDTRDIARGTLASCKDGTSNVYKDKLMMPAYDTPLEFTVGAGEMLKVYVWDSFSGMKPIEMESISALAADAA